MQAKQRKHCLLKTVERSFRNIKQIKRESEGIVQIKAIIFYSKEVQHLKSNTWHIIVFKLSLKVQFTDEDKSQKQTKKKNARSPVSLTLQNILGSLHI